MVVLQILCVKLLTRTKSGIDLVQLQRLFRRYKNLLLLIIETRLQELFLEHFLWIFRPFQIIEVVDKFSFDLVLPMYALLCGLELHILQYITQFIARLSILQKVLHSLYVIPNFPALLLSLKLFHPQSSNLFDSLQLHQILLHFGYLLNDLEVV